MSRRSPAGGRSYKALEKRPNVCLPGPPRSPLATRTLLLESDHAGVPLSPLVLNNTLLSPGRTPRKLHGSAVRIPVNHAPAVQPHDAPPATGSVMALAQVKTPKRCAHSACAAPTPSGRLGRQLRPPVAFLTPCSPNSVAAHLGSEVAVTPVRRSARLGLTPGGSGAEETLLQGANYAFLPNAALLQPGAGEAQHALFDEDDFGGEAAQEGDEAATTAMEDVCVRRVSAVLRRQMSNRSSCSAASADSGGDAAPALGRPAHNGMLYLCDSAGHQHSKATQKSIGGALALFGLMLKCQPDTAPGARAGDVVWQVSDGQRLLRRFTDGLVLPPPPAHQPNRAQLLLDNYPRASAAAAMAPQRQQQRMDMS